MWLRSSPGREKKPLVVEVEVESTIVLVLELRSSYGGVQRNLEGRSEFICMVGCGHFALHAQGVGLVRNNSLICRWLFVIRYVIKEAFKQLLRGNGAL